MSYLGSNATLLFENPTSGIVAQTAKGIFTTRVFSAGTGIAITNADGITANPTFGLTSGVATAGTYTKLTIDTYGRVTSGVQIGLSDIQSGLGVQANSVVLSGPITGGPSSPTFRQLANTDITGFGTMSTQAASGVAITGGTINGAVIGGTTAVAGSFTTITASTSFTLSGTTVSSIATANGLATLDGSGKLTSAQLPAAIVGAVVYQGTWNASTNTPTLVSSTGTKGYYYKVSVAGTTTIDSISSWSLGDTIIFDGTTWDKIDGNAAEVISVAGRSGAVVLGVADVTGAAPLASPALTGVPVAPTASSGTATTQLATTAFVVAQALYMAVTVFTGTGSYGASATDQYVVINKTTGAATGVTLPASPAVGRTITVKDGKGDAVTNNITVASASGTIDGAASFVMDQPYEAYDFVYNGTQWNIA